MKVKQHKKKRLTKKQINIMMGKGYQGLSEVRNKLIQRGLVKRPYSTPTQSGAKRLFIAGAINKKEWNRYLRDRFF